MRALGAATCVQKVPAIHMEHHYFLWVPRLICSLGVRDAIQAADQIHVSLHHLAFSGVLIEQDEEGLTLDQMLSSSCSTIISSHLSRSVPQVWILPLSFPRVMSMISVQ